MKNYKRALRREQKRCHIIRRVKIWYDVWGNSNTTYSEYLEKVLNGERDLWMRTQNVPCSCFNCSGAYKYRLNRAADKINCKKQIDDCIEDMQV